MEKNWVFPFDSAEDLIKTLHTQLAYLFMDALTIRTKVLRSGLSEELLQDLSGAALSLAVEKPFAWEYRLFSQVLCDEISRVAEIKKDLNYGLALGKSVRLGDSAEVIKWVHEETRRDEIRLWNQRTVLFNTAFPKAFGAPGEPGDVEEIIYVAKRLAEVYRRILEWTVEFRHIQVADDFRRLLELIAYMSHNAIEEIEAFAVNYKQQLDDAVRLHEVSKQPQSLEITLTLTIPDMTEFNRANCAA